MPYCGEGQNSRNLKSTPNKAKAYGNKKLIFVSCLQVIDTLTTDKSGYLKLTLPYGTYLVYEPWKFYKKIPQGYNETQMVMSCLQEEWLKEDLKIVISKKTITVANNIILLTCPDKFSCLKNPNSTN
jgi:hypothetical protein